MSVVSILDYGVGNFGSVVRMVEKSGHKAVRINLPEQILEASKIIIPGVGSFDQGMNYLIQRNFVEALKHVANDEKIKILGICLGMQLMCSSSEEGTLPGLGLINAKVTLVNSMNGSLKVPHMGWNTLKVLKKNPLIPMTDNHERFYFVHSYKVQCDDKSDILGVTKYGEEFTAAFQRNNLFGVQFHPEKSHKFGLNLISNFMET